MRRAVPTEHQEQCALIKWAEWQGRTLPALQLLFAVPNGGFRNKVTAAKLKAEGVQAGVPDLFLPAKGREYAGLFIEMKRQNASPSDVTEQQRAWHEKLTAQGFCVRVCKGWDEARKVLLWYLGVTDERHQATN